VIVIVDDEPTIRTLFELVLDRRGHTVAAAGTVADAVALCTQRRPDVVLVDMFMPGGSGVELIRTLRAQEPAPRIIAITGGGTWGGVEVLETAKAAGADVTLRKPVSSNVIVETVEALLDGRSAPDA
jgi:CheY-like chemotaxis protein